MGSVYCPVRGHECEYGDLLKKLDLTERKLEGAVGVQEVITTQRDDAIRQRDMAENRLQGVDLLEEKLNVVEGERNAAMGERNAVVGERDRMGRKLTSLRIEFDTAKNAAIGKENSLRNENAELAEALSAEEAYHNKTRVQLVQRTAERDALRGGASPEFKMCKGCVPCPRGRPCDALEDAYAVIETLGREVWDSHGKTNDWISAWQKANRLWTNSEEELTAERKRTAERIERLKEELRGAQSNSERWETNSDYHRGRAGDQDGKLKETAKKTERLEAELKRARKDAMGFHLNTGKDGIVCSSSGLIGEATFEFGPGGVISLKEVKQRTCL